jgi:hypothetical protein
MVQSLYGAPDDTIWIATRDGLSRFKDGRFVNYRTTDGLFANHIYGVSEDTLGNVWLSCSRGVFRVRKQELDDFAAGRASSITSIPYGIEHGLNSVEATVGSYPTLLRGHDDRMWFATTNGASVLDPRRLSANTLVPPVHLEEVRVDQTSYDPAKAAHAPPGRGDLVFRFTALSYMAPHKVRFRTRLEPYEQEWSEPSALRMKQYTNIPPGRYRFRVIAANNDSVWNETGASCDLHLVPHFYQTYWFRGLLVLAAVLAGVATQRLRIRTLQARERELSTRVEQSLAQIKILRGLLPICASCTKIRDDSGYWSQMETYIAHHSDADFSHSICPDCLVKLYPDYASLTARRPARDEDS